MFSKTLLMCFVFFISFLANASITPTADILMSATIQEYNPNNGKLKNLNDCSGYFGTGSSCKITHEDDSSKIFATVMGKIDTETDGLESANNSTRGDWEDINDSGSGSWTYTGSSYPGVSFWASKGGNEGFILNWMVSQASIDNNYCDPTDAFTMSCLNVAVAVKMGDWATPTLQNLSHITFYGNKCEGNCEPTTTTSVPEPSTLAIFVLGMMGLASRRFKKQS